MTAISAIPTVRLQFSVPTGITGVPLGLGAYLEILLHHRWWEVGFRRASRGFIELSIFTSEIPLQCSGTTPICVVRSVMRSFG